MGISLNLRSLFLLLGFLGKREGGGDLGGVEGGEMWSGRIIGENLFSIKI